MRIFASLVHVKKLGEQLKKLDDKSKPMICIGCEVGTKAYRCYDPNKKSFHIKTDLIFEEESQWDWSVTRNQGL